MFLISILPRFGPEESEPILDRTGREKRRKKQATKQMEQIIRHHSEEGGGGGVEEGVRTLDRGESRSEERRGRREERRERRDEKEARGERRVGSRHKRSILKQEREVREGERERGGERSQKVKFAGSLKKTPAGHLRPRTRMILAPRPPGAYLLQVGGWGTLYQGGPQAAWDVGHRM